MSTTSHFVGFRLSPLSIAKVCTVSICSCKVAREVPMSLAWINAPVYVPPIDGLNPLVCRDFRRGSIISRKRTGERTEPWRTPRSSVNMEDKEPSTLAMLLGDVYQLRSNSRPCHQRQPHRGVLGEQGTERSRTPFVDRRSTCTAFRSVVSKQIEPPRSRI